MTKVEGSTVIARPIEEVFDFVADERNEPTYNPRMIRVAKLTRGPIGVGTRWLARVATKRHPTEVAVEVVDFERPYRITTTSATSTEVIHGSVTFQVDPAGTLMSWSWDVRTKGPLRVLAPVVGALGRRHEKETWAGLKQQLESLKEAG